MKLDIVRAWKDQTYREHLSQEQLAHLPTNPAGDLELSESDLATVYGGDGWEPGGNYPRNGWGDHDNLAAQRNSNICSLICSHNCRIGILDVLSPHPLL
ncbi:MAG TPA: mersacidin/lichenicidin family type 2 lantibiotic [Ktedonobacteraceae bacterium]|jgi:mersacidin/lichenicidin family type 2 lantibiotic